MTAASLAVFALQDAPEWMRSRGESAICAQVDADLWFPEKGQRSSVVAKRLCQSCPLMDACREWALAHPALAEFGVWGGLTEHERRMLRRRGRRGLAPVHVTREAA